MVVPIHLRDGAEEPPNPSLARNRTVLEAVGANLPRAKHGTQDGGKKRYWSQRRGGKPRGWVGDGRCGQADSFAHRELFLEYSPLLAHHRSEWSYHFAA